jgi:hypothetical protein
LIVIILLVDFWSLGVSLVSPRATAMPSLVCNASQSKDDVVDMGEKMPPVAKQRDRLSQN